ncbi:MAG: GDP-L-fucose synthase [Burkholderiales bacterium]|nr:GDP-L-fucose synthase [Burkholderiales bacterium]
MGTDQHPARIYVAGHKGMVGSAIVRALQTHGNGRYEIIGRTHAELDLVDQRAVNDFFAYEKPDQVYLAAARVGGIHANNTYPAGFIYDNLMIQSNVIHAAHVHGVRKLLFLGSSCIYPQLATQPMTEEALLTGPLEPTNEPYAIAKIAGIKLCESYARQHGRDYRSVMPTNLYGPGDNYHAENSHVIPALIRRFHEARVSGAPKVLIWGTGAPRREFLHVDDMASASVYVMELKQADYAAQVQPQLSHINVGSGHEVPISELARLVARVVGYSGQIGFDTSRPDGAPRKLMDSARLQRMGWRPRVGLEAGLAQAYQDFQSSLQQKVVRER